MEIIQYISENIFIFMVIFARITGLFIMAPIFSNKLIPVNIKLIFSLILTYIITLSSSYPRIEDLYTLFFLIILEFSSGVLIGMVSAMFLNVIGVMGSAVDFVLGMGMVQAASLSGDSSESLSAIIIEYMAILLFLITNGHLYIIYIISKDMSLINLLNLLKDGSFIDWIIKIFNFIIINGINLAIPFILVLMLIDLCLGIVNKSFPSFNVFLFSLPAKALIFVLVMMYYVYFFGFNFQNLFNINMDFLNDFLVRLIKH